MSSSTINIRSLVFIWTPLFYVVGGFANNNYWSSSEYDNNNAWKQNFNNGNQNNNNKNNTNYVRAVRGFKQIIFFRKPVSVYKDLTAFSKFPLFKRGLGGLKYAKQKFTLQQKIKTISKTITKQFDFRRNNSLVKSFTC